jgi:hypothetical protein
VSSTGKRGGIACGRDPRPVRNDRKCRSYGNKTASESGIDDADERLNIQGSMVKRLMKGVFMDGSLLWRSGPVVESNLIFPIVTAKVGVVTAINWYGRMLMSR